MYRFQVMGEVKREFCGPEKGQPPNESTWFRYHLMDGGTHFSIV